MKKDITIQISDAIELDHNRKLDEFLSSFAQMIASHVRCMYSSGRYGKIMFNMPAKVGSLYCVGPDYKVWQRKILPHFSDEEIKIYAKELGLKISYNLENGDRRFAYYSLWFDFFPEDKPLTKVQIFANKIRKHYKKVKEKRIAIAKIEPRIEYLRNAPNRKKERLQSYEVYKECLVKLHSKNFKVDGTGLIMIQLKNSDKFDMNRLNKFLARVGLVCKKQEFNIIYLLNS